MSPRLLTATSLAALALTGCSKQIIDPSRQIGANPFLPEPKQFLFPPMGIANIVGWKNGQMPTVPAG